MNQTEQGRTLRKCRKAVENSVRGMIKFLLVVKDIRLIILPNIYHKSLSGRKHILPMDMWRKVKEQSQVGYSLQPTYLPMQGVLPFVGKDNGLPQELLIQALEQIHYSLQAGLDLELQRYRVLMQLNSATPVKIEEVHSSLPRQETKLKINLSLERKTTINDTKNIPKNFGKAVIAFITKNPKVTARCLARHQIDPVDFNSSLKARKRNLHSIKELRSLWLQEEFVYAKPFRELSLYFLKRGSFRYIFGSRVMDFVGHLKYRTRIMEALGSPLDFNSIKK